MTASLLIVSHYFRTSIRFSFGDSEIDVESNISVGNNDCCLFY